MRNATGTSYRQRILKNLNTGSPPQDWAVQIIQEIGDGFYDGQLAELLQAMNDRMYLTSGRSFPLPVVAPPPNPVVQVIPRTTDITYGHFYRWPSAPRKLRDYIFKATGRGKGGAVHAVCTATYNCWLTSALESSHTIPATQRPLLQEVWPQTCSGANGKACSGNRLQVFSVPDPNRIDTYTCYECAEMRSVAGAIPSAVFGDEIAQMEEGSFGTRPVKVGKPEEKYGDKIKVPAKAVCVHPVVRLGKCIVCNEQVRVARKPAKIARRQS